MSQPVTCRCGCLIFVRENGTIVPHWKDPELNGDQQKCEMNDKQWCDCHLHHQQVCDVCQGVLVASPLPSEGGAIEAKQRVLAVYPGAICTQCWIGCWHVRRNLADYEGLSQKENGVTIHTPEKAWIDAASKLPSPAPSQALDEAATLAKAGEVYESGMSEEQSRANHVASLTSTGSGEAMKCACYNNHDKVPCCTCKCHVVSAPHPQPSPEPTLVDPRIYANPDYLRGLEKRIVHAFEDKEFKAVRRLFEAEIEEMENRAPPPMKHPHPERKKVKP